ncbi:MAG: TlpA family protein disulfide reductase, partial [Chloroflexi bacterium]
MALDKNADDARPWIEAAGPTHPSLIDTKHLVADLYNMVNVPTILWIDEDGRIVRPNDVAYGNNQWQEMHGFDAEVHKSALRTWVHGTAPAPFTSERARQLQQLPNA